MNEVLADEVVVFTAPKPFGGEGVPALSPDARRALETGAKYRILEKGHAGFDRFHHLERVF